MDKRHSVSYASFFMRKLKGAEQMLKVYKEVYGWRDFDFWSGGKETANDLTADEIETIFDYLADAYPEGMDETEVNDFFWFERDTIAEWLGYRDYEELMKRDEADEDEEENEDEEDEEEESE